MNDKKPTLSVFSAEKSAEAQEDLDSSWRRVIRRRKFLQGLGAAGVALPATALFADNNSQRLSKNDAKLLQLVVTIEQIEADLWQQYNELGGAVDRNDQPNPGNPPYVAALQNLDGDMPQYISDNTDDEISHAAFLAAYLKSKGVAPVDLSSFATLQGSQATGANKTAGRITNLLNLNVDTSWYFRYRSTQNPDLGATFPQLLNITNEPVIPLNDTDTPPGIPIGLFQPPITNPQALRVQAIANAAGFHFAAIEQGGSSLYPILCLKATGREALRILLSIGGVEIDHFSLWHDKGGNAIAGLLAGVTDPKTGVSFPDFNNAANQHNGQLSPADQAAGSQMFQTNLILPEPCQFLDPSLPPVSIIRTTLTQNGGGVATIRSFIASNLFQNQTKAFLELVMDIASDADAVRHDGDNGDD